MKNNIQTYVQLFSNNVELHILVKEDLSKQTEALENFGYIQIHDGSLDVKEIFWDNLNFFLNCRKKDFKKECKKELKKAGYDWEETYHEIKALLFRADKLNILTF